MDQESNPLGFERNGQINTVSSSKRRRSIARKSHGKRVWKFTLRAWDDDQKQDWWFAGTAIPLLAATGGPLANVLSIAALVTYWRMCLVAGVDAATCPWDGDLSSLVSDLEGRTYADPQLYYDLNIVSLVLGFIGNLFLLFNFTNRIRYIIALPATILLWYTATGILIGIMVSMNEYVPPISPQQTYSQGFWYALLATILYLVCSMLLMVNMLGYFLGHYPQRFNLTDAQRTLILQTMLFFIWLAGGAGVFAKVETEYGEGVFDWTYVNALYFCDVTILTVGFGDIYPTSNVGRGLVLPYSVGGIIMLGLVISSVSKFATELGEDKVLMRHVERARERTVGRSVTTSMELKERTFLAGEGRPSISAPSNPIDRTMSLRIMDNDEDVKKKDNNTPDGPLFNALKRSATMPLNVLRPKPPRLLLLREEKDRFDAMRRIEHNTEKWKQWYSLFVSVTEFGILWCIGAVVFWICERPNRIQGITYFQSLYLCYVSLLTIGYGDLAPKSNAGRPFFVVWSLVAVPTMTLLIADMSDTVISDFKQGTYRLGDFTILPKAGIWRMVLMRIPWLWPWLQTKKERKATRRRLDRGFETGFEGEGDIPPTIDTLAKEETNDFELVRKLARAIRHTANDLKADPPKRYSYEEWVQFTRLIRFTSKNKNGRGQGKEDQEDKDGLIEWDWIGEDSPLMTQGTEAEFVLDRLCESMNRYLRRLEDDDPERKVEVDTATDRDSNEETQIDELNDDITGA